MANMKKKLYTIGDTRRAARHLRLQVEIEAAADIGDQQRQRLLARYAEAHDEFDAILHALELYVLGGGEVGPGDVPECVALKMDTEFKGSGVCVAPQWILTIAHNEDATKVFKGESVQKSDVTNTVDVDSVHVVIPNALILLKLTTPLPNAVPAVFPHACPIAWHMPASMAGFGFNSSRGGNGIKRMGDVLINSVSSSAIFVFSNAVQMCEGDSGGPMFITHNGNRILAGIAERTRTDSLCGPDGEYVPVENAIGTIETLIGAPVWKCPVPP
jgi:hypothetical protein